MFFCVMFGGFLGVMFGMNGVSVCDLSVVGGVFVTAGLMVLGGFGLMLGRVGLMLCREFGRCADSETFDTLAWKLGELNQLY